MASTRPAAFPSATVSAPSGFATEPIIASAWSKLIMQPLFAPSGLTSTTPKRAPAATARTSRPRSEAYPCRGKGGERDGLVYWAYRSDGGPSRGAAKGARQTEGARANRGPRKPSRPDPHRRDPDGGKL